MIYEIRTYQVKPGQVREYENRFAEAYPTRAKYSPLLGYWHTEIGPLNQLVHIWKFKDDGDRRTHWAAVFANKDFVEGFASKFRPLVMSQEVKLMTEAPWGPHP